MKTEQHIKPVATLALIIEEYSEEPLLYFLLTLIVRLILLLILLLVLPA